jgi:hypothetical protein
MRVASFDVGIKNLAFVVAELAPGSAAARVERWRTVSLCEGDARALAPSDAVERVVRALDELDFLDCDAALVEMQPRFAPQNVRVAHAIATHFVVRKRVDLGERVVVEFVHAARKNALAARVLGDAPARPAASLPKGKGAAYARNKRQAVAACAALVERAGDAALRATWEAFAKKDDAADALLQLLAWSGRGAVAGAAARHEPSSAAVSASTCALASTHQP